MQRFFIEQHLAVDSELDLSEGISRQLSQVLRARVGEHIVLLDDSGSEYESELLQLSGRHARVRVLSANAVERRAPVRLTLCQALVRPSKLEWVLQKGTELGVDGFIPLVTERSLRKNEKQKRWRTIIREAAEQSGRTRLPQLHAPVALKDLLFPETALVLIADPESPLTLKQSLPEVRPSEVYLLIGPEGGFTSAEVFAAEQRSARRVSLGPLTLRTETAGLAAASALFFHYGS